MSKELEIKTYSQKSQKTINNTKEESTEVVSPKRDNGLRAGALSIIFLYIAVVSYVNPFSISTIPYGLVLGNYYLVPESIYLMILSGFLALSFSIIGVIKSIFRFSVLGFLLSLIVIGNVSAFGIQSYNVYKLNPTMIDSVIQTTSMENITKNFSMVKKSEFLKK